MTSIIVRKCAISLSDRGGREGGKIYLKCVTFRKKLRTYEMLPKCEVLHREITSGSSNIRPPAAECLHAIKTGELYAPVEFFRLSARYRSPR